jgi:glycogen operon protein
LKAAAAASNLLDDFRTTLITTGVNFADPVTQGMITQLSPAWPAEVTAALRALGITHRSIAAELMGREATQADIDQARRRNYEDSVQSRATNAAALFHSRMEQSAEPWDAAGGSLLGRLPVGWCEWNGEYRDSVRRFWRGDAGELGRFTSALAGSSPIFAPSGRGAEASVNFVACHDGPTLADLTSYERKHNDANGESNRDGPAESFACNWGVEGETSDERISSERRRATRNLLATLALSLGVPMVQHGDELGRTQRGLDNGYCQDNPTTWVDWTIDGDAKEILRFARRAFALRRNLATLRRRIHFTGHAGPGSTRDLVWLHPSGREMTVEDWHDPAARAVAACYDTTASGGERLSLLVNAGDAPVAFTLDAGEGTAGTWRVLLTTFDDADENAPGAMVMVAPRSLILLEPMKEDPRA